MFSIGFLFVEDITKDNNFDLVFTTKPKPKPKDKQAGWEYLGYAGQVGFTVAIPICIGALAGKSFDTKNGTYPTATLVGLGIGTVLSVLGFIGFVREILTKRSR